MVGVEEGETSGGSPLPSRQTRREARARQRRTARNRRDCGEEARPTDEQWAPVRPLLPQRSGIGRPPNNHRAVLGGMLWGRGRVPRGGRCPRSTALGRPPTDVTNCGCNKASGRASSVYWQRSHCQERRRRSPTDAVGTVPTVSLTRIGLPSTECGAYRGAKR